MPPIVWVQWLDSTSRSGWQAPAEWRDSAGLVLSVGWLVHEDDRIIVIAPSHEVHDKQVFQNFLSSHSIPKGAITDWGELTGIF